jgi:hypothetical protein
MFFVLKDVRACLYLRIASLITEIVRIKEIYSLQPKIVNRDCAE